MGGDVGVTHVVNVEKRDPVEPTGIGRRKPGGWFATCETCGWTSNGPDATKAAATEAKKYHLATAQIEEARAAAVEAFYAAESDQERDAASEAYRAAGAIDG